MKASRKTCLICDRSYRPDPRTASFQKACPREACGRERRRRKWLSWHKRHPHHRRGDSSRNKTKAWAKAYPDYWKRYRAKNDVYRERERRRMSSKRRRLRRVAKTTAIREDAVEKLLKLHVDPDKTVAKPTAIARRVDALVDYLIWRECVAKPTAMARGPTMTR